MPEKLPARIESVAVERWAENQDLAPPMVNDYEDWSVDRLREWALDAIPETARLWRISEGARQHVGLVLWRLRQEMADGPWGEELVQTSHKTGVAARTLSDWMAGAVTALGLPKTKRALSQEARRDREKQAALPSGADSQKQGKEGDETKDRAARATPGGKARQAATASKVAPKVSDSEPDTKQDGDLSEETSALDASSETSKPAPGSFGTDADDIKAAAKLLIIMGPASVMHCLSPQQADELRALVGVEPVTHTDVPLALEPAWTGWLAALEAEPASKHPREWWQKFGRNRQQDTNKAIAAKMGEAK